MQHEFDIFEKLPDNSKIWKARVFGEYNAKRKLQELAEHSDNPFIAIDLQRGDILPPNPANYTPQFKAKGVSR